MSIKLTLCAPDEVREWGPAAHWRADTSDRTPGMLVVWRHNDVGDMRESYSFPLHRVVCCHISIPERPSSTRVFPHGFSGRPDRWCDLCGLPDRNPIHSAPEKT